MEGFEYDCYRSSAAELPHRTAPWPQTQCQGTRPHLCKQFALQLRRQGPGVCCQSQYHLGRGEGREEEEAGRMKVTREGREAVAIPMVCTNINFAYIRTLRGCLEEFTVLTKCEADRNGDLRQPAHCEAYLNTPLFLCHCCIAPGNHNNCDQTHNE